MRFGRGSGWAGVLLVLSALAAVSTPRSSAAQEPFEGWLTLHVGPRYDFTVAPASRSESVGEADSVRVVRLITNRMLVRKVEEERLRVISDLEAAGREPAGYDQYMATSRVLEIRCASDLLSVWEVTDHDRTGRILRRDVLERRWISPEDDAHPRAARIILEWACREGEAGL